MADTRGLLDRISAFRQRLDRTPDLGPADPMAVVAALGPPPAAGAVGMTRQPDSGPQLTTRARKLLEDARGLVETQRKLSADRLIAAATDPADPLARYHRGSVGLTETAVRLVQSLPASAEMQLRTCDGLEQLLKAVRDRLAILDQAVTARRTDTERIETVAGLLVAVNLGREMTLDPFVAVAEGVLDDARSGARVRFLTADASEPTKCIAAHAVTVAQVMARLVQQDYEWASRPLIPVVAALLMDCGMLRVPAAVFTTAGPLTAEQIRAVEQHPRVGADLVRRCFPDAALLAEAVATHHERLDGTGYPNGLRNESVPTLGRFLAAADVYAAAASARPHRPANDPRAALTDSLLLADQGQLDRDFTEYLMSFTFHPVGTVVELHDGRTAVVAATPNTRANLRASGRPVVAVLADAAGSLLPRPEFVDLAAADRGGVARALTLAERRHVLGDGYPDLCW